MFSLTVGASALLTRKQSGGQQTLGRRGEVGSEWIITLRRDNAKVQGTEYGLEQLIFVLFYLTPGIKPEFWGYQAHIVAFSHISMPIKFL